MSVTQTEKIVFEITDAEREITYVEADDTGQVEIVQGDARIILYEAEGELSDMVDALRRAAKRIKQWDKQAIAEQAALDEKKGVRQ